MLCVTQSCTFRNRNNRLCLDVDRLMARMAGVGFDVVWDIFESPQNCLWLSGEIKCSRGNLRGICKGDPVARIQRKVKKRERGKSVRTRKKGLRMPKRERKNGEALGINLKIPAIVARQKKCRVRGGGDDVFKIVMYRRSLLELLRLSGTNHEVDFATATAHGQDMGTRHPVNCLVRAALQAHAGRHHITKWRKSFT